MFAGYASGTAPLVFLNDLWRFDLGLDLGLASDPTAGGAEPWTDVLRAELAGAGSHWRDCHFAAPPSTFNGCFN